MSAKRDPDDGPLWPLALGVSVLVVLVLGVLALLVLVLGGCSSSLPARPTPSTEPRASCRDELVWSDPPGNTILCLIDPCPRSVFIGLGTCL